MEGKEEDERLREIKFSEMQPIGTAAQTDKHNADPPPVPLFDPSELSSWSFYRAGIAEFMTIFLFLYIAIQITVTGVVESSSRRSTAWALGGVIFALAYCTGGISDGHINPAVTFGLFLARKLSLARALFYMVMQCLGAICCAGTVKWLQKGVYEDNGVGASAVAASYAESNGLGAEIMGTFLLVCIVCYATDAERRARDARFPIPANLPIGNIVFLFHPMAETGINPARRLGAAIIYDKGHAWDDHWIFWVGPFIGAALAALCRQIVVESRSRA